MMRLLSLIFILLFVVFAAQAANINSTSTPTDAAKEQVRAANAFFAEFEETTAEKAAPPEVKAPVTPAPPTPVVVPTSAVPVSAPVKTRALPLWDAKAMVNEGVLEPRLALSSPERGLSGLTLDEVDCRILDCSDQTLLFRSAPGGGDELERAEIVGICPQDDLLEDGGGLTCRPGKLLKSRDALLSRQGQEAAAQDVDAATQRGIGDLLPFDKIAQVIKSLVCTVTQRNEPALLPVSKRKAGEVDSSEEEGESEPQESKLEGADDVARNKIGGSRSPELLLAIAGRTLVPWFNDQVYTFSGCDNRSLEVATLKAAQKMQLTAGAAQSWRAGSIDPAGMSCAYYDCDNLFVAYDNKKRVLGLFSSNAISADGNFVNPAQIITSSAGASTLSRSALATAGSRLRERGEEVTNKVMSPSPFASGQYYALVIGIDQYKHINRLENAVNDARSIAATLERQYAFETRILLDEQATRDNVMRALNELRKKLSENDSLLIYYSGHGFYDQNTDTSYWMPVDAEPDDTTRWIESRSITDQLKLFASRHVLIVADSCFSGTMTRAGNTGLTQNQTRDNYLKKLQEKPSRVLIASGGNEPVADAGGTGHSIFSDVLLRSLERPFASVFTAEELMSRHLRESVAGRAEQTPEYRIIRNSGHDGGDFVFVHRAARD